MSQPYPPPPQVPIFQVNVMTHTGLLIMFLNQRRTVTGTYQQCDAAIRQAQTHCLTLGWWGVASILFWNWLSLAHNSNARKQLNAQAQQAQAYAQWYGQYGQHYRP